MFMVLLKFSDAKERAGELMDGHKAWIQKGFDDGVFLMTGSLETSGGGAVMAHGVTLGDLEARVARDPFVAGNVVEPEIIAVAPARTDARLDFLRAEA